MGKAKRAGRVISCLQPAGHFAFPERFRNWQAVSDFVPTIEDDFVSPRSFALASGTRLPELKQRYAIYGNLDEAKSNAVLVFHALTGSARVHEWWRDLIGAGKALDTENYAIICINFLGSCYGSTGARNSAEATAENSETEFPLVTVTDIVRAQKMVLDSLGIENLKAVLGGSVGGMCALRFACKYPESAEKCIAVGACELPAMGLALNHLQREALRIENGVGLARQLAMLSYKSPELLNRRFARRPNRNGENPHENFAHRFDVAGYLDYQSEIFKNRFDWETFKVISKAMDLFELANEEIRRVKAETYFVGISSDWLFPAADVKNLSERFARCAVKTNFIEMISPDGHDAFLSDTRQMNRILKGILAANDHEKARKLSKTSL